MVLGPLDWKSGRPKNADSTIMDPTRQRPILGPLTLICSDMIFRIRYNLGPDSSQVIICGGMVGGCLLKAFQPEFGAYRGLARVLKSPSNPSKLQKEGETPGKGHFYFLRQTLVCTNPWFKRDLMSDLCKARVGESPGALSHTMVLKGLGPRPSSSKVPSSTGPLFLPFFTWGGSSVSSDKQT